MHTGTHSNSALKHTHTNAGTPFSADPRKRLEFGSSDRIPASSAKLDDQTENSSASNRTDSRKGTSVASVGNGSASISNKNCTTKIKGPFPFSTTVRQTCNNSNNKEKVTDCRKLPGVSIQSTDHDDVGGPEESRTKYNTINNEANRKNSSPRGSGSISSSYCRSVAGNGDNIEQPKASNASRYRNRFFGRRRGGSRYREDRRGGSRYRDDRYRDDRRGNGGYRGDRGGANYRGDRGSDRDHYDGRGGDRINDDRGRGRDDFRGGGRDRNDSRGPIRDRSPERGGHRGSSPGRSPGRGDYRRRSRSRSRSLPRFRDDDKVSGRSPPRRYDERGRNEDHGNRFEENARGRSPDNYRGRDDRGYRIISTNEASVSASNNAITTVDVNTRVITTNITCRNMPQMEDRFHARQMEDSEDSFAHGMAKKVKTIPHIENQLLRSHSNIRNNSTTEEPSAINEEMNKENMNTTSIVNTNKKRSRRNCASSSSSTVKSSPLSKKRGHFLMPSHMNVVNTATDKSQNTKRIIKNSLDDASSNDEYVDDEEEVTGGFDDDGGSNDDENYENAFGTVPNNGKVEGIHTNTNTPASGGTDRLAVPTAAVPTMNLDGKVEGINNNMTTPALGDADRLDAPTAAIAAMDFDEKAEGNNNNHTNTLASDDNDPLPAPTVTALATVHEVSVVSAAYVGTVPNPDVSSVSAITQTMIDFEGLIEDTNNNNTNPPPLVGTDSRAPSTDTVDPPEGTAENNNNTNPPSSFATVQDIFPAPASDSTVPNHNPPLLIGTNPRAAPTDSVVTENSIADAKHNDNNSDNNKENNMKRSRLKDLVIMILDTCYMQARPSATNIIGNLTYIASADKLKGDNDEFKNIAAAFGAVSVIGEQRKIILNPNNAPMNTIISYFLDNNIICANEIIREMIHIFKNTYNRRNKPLYQSLAPISKTQIINDLEASNTFDGDFPHVLYIPTSSDPKLRFFPRKYPLIDNNYYYIKTVLMRLENGDLIVCHSQGNSFDTLTFSFDDGGAIADFDWEDFRSQCIHRHIIIELIKMHIVPEERQKDIVGARPVRQSQHPKVTLTGGTIFGSEQDDISCGPDGLTIATMLMTGVKISFEWARQKWRPCTADGYRDLTEMKPLFALNGLAIRKLKRWDVGDDATFFNYTSGTFIFVFEFDEEDGNSAQNKLRHHTAVYDAEKRHIMDNCGPATILDPRDLIDNRTIQLALKAKWGDKFRFKILKVFKITESETATELGTSAESERSKAPKSVNNKSKWRKKTPVFDERSKQLTAEVERHATASRDAGVGFTGRVGNAKDVLHKRYQKKYDQSISISKKCFVHSHFRSTKNNASLFTSVFVCPVSGECFPSGNLISVNDVNVYKDTALNWYKNKNSAMVAAAARAEDNFCSRLSRQGEGNCNINNRTKLHQFCNEPTYSAESDILLSLERFKMLDGTAAETIDTLKTKISRK